MRKRSERTTLTPDTALTQDTTLKAALRHIAQTRWRGLRTLKTSLCQGDLAVADICALLGKPRELLTAGEVTPAHVAALVDKWLGEGFAPGTITRRLGIMGMLGLPTSGQHPKPSRALKWWLRPTSAVIIRDHLAELGTPAALAFADYIAFVSLAGLRVEEVLRITRDTITLEEDGVFLSVEGTKTSGSQATIFLGLEVRAVFERRLAAINASETRLWPYDYQWAWTWWTYCRKLIGAENDPMATLKSLRRTAARYLHITMGLPIDVVRHVLRHENVETTMGYLRLVGGYEAEEMRRLAARAAANRAAGQ